VSIFRDMQEIHAISTQWQFNELKRMLHEAIERGFVETVTPLARNGRVPDGEEWYREVETGQIYRLQPPEERGGWWGPVEFAGFSHVTDTIQ
jgi:hypothetical protein